MKLEEEKQKNENTVLYTTEETFLQGCDLVKNKKNYEAYFKFLKAAKKGHLKAQYKLGVMFEKGEGVEVDIKKAKIWYERVVKEAEQGGANIRKYIQKIKMTSKLRKYRLKD